MSRTTNLFLAKHRTRALGMATALALCAPELRAGQPGAPQVHIVDLWANSAKGFDNNHRAQVLSSALRDHVVNAPDFFLYADTYGLLQVGVEAKCDTLPFTAPTLTESSDKGMNRACLSRMAKRLGAKAFFWGHLFSSEGGRLWAKVHLWQQGEDRVFALPYDEKNPRRVAERLYQHLVTPGKVGDARFTMPTSGTAPRGELFVNDRSYGPWEAEGVELTLPLGEAVAELRWGDKVLARGRGAVAATGTATVLLDSVAEPPAPAEPLRRYPPIEMGQTPGTETAPSGGWMTPVGWVTLGTGVAALGLGVFANSRVASSADDFRSNAALAAYGRGLARGQSSCSEAERGFESGWSGAASSQTVRDHCSRSDTWKTVRTVSYIGGSLFVVGGAALLLFAPSTSERAQADGKRSAWFAAPNVGPSFVGASIASAW
jgi:hypothetical protein